MRRRILKKTILAFIQVTKKTSRLRLVELKFVFKNIQIKQTIKKAQM